MKGAIMQPTLFPWLGYFAMIDAVDKFVFLDSVQLVKRSWQVRNRIKQNESELMLTIPVQRGNRDEMLICNTLITHEEGWKRKHLESIKHCYSKAPYFEEIFNIIKSVYEGPIDTIGNFNIMIITKFCEYIGIDTKLVRSSEIENLVGKKDDLLVNICKEEGIDVYLSAKGSGAYIEQKNEGGAFSRNAMQLEYQNYEHPTYKQQGSTFIPYMGIIDLLFNEGKNSLEIIRSGCRESYTSMDIKEELEKFENW